MDKKIIFALVLALCLGPGAAMAEEREKEDGPGLSAWLKRLQNRIAQMAPKKIIPMGTSVAGTRGAKEEAEAGLYWKGKKAEETVTEEELAVFKEGVDLAARGERLAAIKELEAFMAVFPESPLVPDANKTLNLVKAEPREEKREEAKKAE